MDTPTQRPPANPNNIATHPRALFHQERNTRIRRLRAMVTLFLFLFLLVVFKLVEIQLIRSDFYTKEAKKYRTSQSTFYSRGRLLDRNGQILAQDVIVYDVYAHPRYYFKQDPKIMATELSKAMNLPEEKLYTNLTKPYPTISLAKSIDKATQQRIVKLGLSGIETHRRMLRKYPQGPLASHIIGYVNDEAGVAAGIEKTAFDTLRQIPNMQETEVSGQGELLNLHKFKADFITHIPRANDVELTIDSRIQYAAEKALATGLKASYSKRGCVVVMAPKTGEILAFAAEPGFEPERYYKANADQLKNWAITDVYPPGSTMKIITVASGLQAGVINRNSTIYDSGKVTMDKFTIQNYDYAKNGAPGNINLVHLLLHSSNIASLKISSMIDKKVHYDLLRKFGFGSPTKIDLTGESSGILDKPDMWSDLQHATMGYGYGLASTPIQMAAAVGAIANGGVWITPHVQRNQANIVRRRAISEKNATILTEILTESIEGSKTSAFYIGKGYQLAGKTGTSRKPATNGRGYSTDVFTSFVGFFPADNPKVLMMVVVDSPKIGNAWGSTVAGPIFREVALQTAGFLGIKPVTMQSTGVQAPQKHKRTAG